MKNVKMILPQKKLKKELGKCGKDYQLKAQYKTKKLKINY